MCTIALIPALPFFSLRSVVLRHPLELFDHLLLLVGHMLVPAAISEHLCSGGCKFCVGKK